MNAFPSTPIPIVRFERIDSTSLYARRLVESPTPPTSPMLLIADEQTGGVGRFLRPWASPRGGLWCTLVFPLATSAAPAAALEGLGLKIGVACLHTVMGAVADADGGGGGVPEPPHHIDVRLKWPNDVLINGRKVLGVLSEIVHTAASSRAYALVGVGINANLDEADLPPMLRESATTLRAVLGRDTDLAALADELARRLSGTLAGSGVRGLDGATLAAARKHLARIGEQVHVTLPDRTTVSGTLTGLNDEGRPILSTPGGTVVLPPGADLL